MWFNEKRKKNNTYLSTLYIDGNIKLLCNIKQEDLFIGMMRYIRKLEIASKDNKMKEF